MKESKRSWHKHTLCSLPVQLWHDFINRSFLLNLVIWINAITYLFYLYSIVETSLDSSFCEMQILAFFSTFSSPNFYHLCFYFYMIKMESVYTVFCALSITSFQKLKSIPSYVNYLIIIQSNQIINCNLYKLNFLSCLGFFFCCVFLNSIIDKAVYEQKMSEGSHFSPPWQEKVKVGFFGQGFLASVHGCKNLKGR